MVRLTREVRFAINARPDLPGPSSANGHAGVPALRGLGHYFALRATLAGTLDPRSQYLLNIKQVDQAVRQRALPLIESALAAGQFDGGPLMQRLFQTLRDAWPGATLDELALALSPFLSFSVHAREYPMLRLSQRFEFSASHRLHNPALDDEQNRKLFGKCSNPFGHGHNYELQVTLRGQLRDHGTLIDIPAFERLVAETVIDRFDHRNLNVEIPEFRGLIPTVENIARVIYGLLKPALGAAGADLAAVTVWETPKTWCEYSED